jgi:hypothetical protein
MYYHLQPEGVMIGKELDLPKLIVDVTKGMSNHEKQRFEQLLVERVPVLITEVAQAAKKQDTKKCVTILPRSDSRDGIPNS